MKFLSALLILFLSFSSLSAFASEPLSTLELLKELVRIDTSNPPGNETAAARFIQDYLKKFGIDSEIIESKPGRGNLIARLKGNGKKESLALLGHLDVVPADPKEWKHPPFEAVVEGDHIHGRGTLDMKGLAALEINTVARLKLENFPLEGDVLLILTADEEAGGKEGAHFLVQNHWEKVKTPQVFSEGSIGVEREGMNLYPVQVAEKGVAWMKLTATGASGHGSMPTKDNAVLKLIRAIDRLTARPEPLERTAVVQEFLNQLSQSMPFPQSWVLKHFFDGPVKALAPKLAGDFLEKQKAFGAMIRNTVTPTMLQAGYKTNVIPAEATGFIDARILPGWTAESFRKKLEERLSDPGIKIEVVMESLPNESDFRTPFFQTLKKSIQSVDPKALVAPYMSPGATDLRFFREKGSTCYGIIPFVASQEEIDTVHGKDERVRISEIARGEKILYNLVTSLQGGPSHESQPSTTP